MLKVNLIQLKMVKLEVEILKGQESFRIQSFVKSNIWTLLPSGKSKFKKGEIVDCFFPNHPINFINRSNFCCSSNYLELNMLYD